MKAFAVALLGLVVTTPVLAGPYVSTKSELRAMKMDTQKCLTKQE